MKIALLFTVAFLLVIAAYPQSPIARCYVGLEKMAYEIDPAKPDEKWYQLTFIQIKGDTAEVAQEPIGIYKNDTVYSASDGAFYYYRGKIIVHDGKVIMNLVMTHCDYCAVPVDSGKINRWSHKMLTGQICTKGMIIKGSLFKPTIDANHFIHRSARLRRLPQSVSSLH